MKESIANIDFEVFSKNQMMIDTVLLNIAIIGEIVKKLTEDVKKRYPDIPWENIAGMSN